MNAVAAPARKPFDISQMKQRASENHSRLYEIAVKAQDEGKPLSRVLEELDPSVDYPHDLGLDAFERLLAFEGIRTTPDPYNGIPADPLEKFLSRGNADKNGIALLMEFFNRTWRAAKYGGKRRDYGAVPDEHQRLTFGSDDLPVGSVYRPYVDAAGLRYKQIAPSIPISELVATTTTVDNDQYRAAYLTEPTAAQLRMSRVAQGADIPRVKIGTRSQAIKLYKYGRAIESTYEALRRTPIDLVALLLSRIAVQADEDKVGTIVDVIVNGDGNAGTSATSYNLTTLDSGTTAPNITMLAWLAWLFKWPNPYALTTVLTQETGALKLATINVGTPNAFMIEMAGVLGIGRIRPINPEFDGSVAAGVTTWAPTGKLVGFDRRYAVERVIEAGADINESMRWIVNQTEILTMTEIEGYAIFDANASRIMDFTA